MSTPEARPDLACPVCRTTFVVTGETEQARRLAIAEWSSCCRKTPGASGGAPGTDTPGADVVGGSAAPGATDSGAPDVLAEPTSPRVGVPAIERPAIERPASGAPVSRLLSGVPRWIRRRMAIGGVW